jgi:hypothetical protein
MQMIFSQNFGEKRSPQLLHGVVHKGEATSSFDSAQNELEALPVSMPQAGATHWFQRFICALIPAAFT